MGTITVQVQLEIELELIRFARKMGATAISSRPHELTPGVLVMNISGPSIRSREKSVIFVVDQHVKTDDDGFIVGYTEKVRIEDSPYDN